MRAVVSVMGCDKPGIIAKTTTLLAENQVNILDITQTILQDIFTMVMLVDLQNCKLEFAELAARLDALGKELEVEIRMQHEEIFHSMHRI